MSKLITELRVDLSNLGYEVTKVGKLERTNKRIRIAAKRECIESAFMGMAFKHSRAEEQRESRRSKRK